MDLYVHERILVMKNFLLSTTTALLFASSAVAQSPLSIAQGGTSGNTFAAVRVVNLTSGGTWTALSSETLVRFIVIGQGGCGGGGGGMSSP